MGDPLLPSNATDEEHIGPVDIDAVVREQVRRLFGSPSDRVDAVAHHVNGVGVDEGVCVEDVELHAVRDGDDRARFAVGRGLNPRGDPVAAAELLGLPRPTRLERVRGDHVRDPIELGGQVPGEVRVPGVGVDDIHMVEDTHHVEVDSEGLQSGIRGAE
ncbi:unannotated protein [freshwater metagenome]|uniref:Unannotated protein n=1 Tax=freshwater metagenome TaxID=449393 RepID=A0A6J7KR09_9ZZZZ